MSEIDTENAGSWAVIHPASDTGIHERFAVGEYTCLAGFGLREPLPAAVFIHLYVLLLRSRLGAACWVKLLYEVAVERREIVVIVITRAGGVVRMDGAKRVVKLSWYSS